ncbi:heterogeneous nuclear ribonucleoprotein K isoform X2 [Planococcus citri]
MKRFNDGFSGGPPKRSKIGPDDVEIRILIPSKVAGSIIGKGGGNIARLRADFVAKVTVPDCPGPERILTVISTFENAVNVINEVLPNLENSSAGGRGKQNRGAVDENSTVDDVDLRVLVHQSQAGCIIGKGGGKVKELREKTGARIKIYSNCCPDSTDRVVQLTGASSTAIECLKEILELIRTQAPIKGQDTPYDPNNYDDYYADEYGGYGTGGGGSGFDAGRGPMRGGPVGRGPPAGRFGGGPPPRGAPLGGPPARGGFRGGYGGVDDCEYNSGGVGVGGGGGGGGGGAPGIGARPDLMEGCSPMVLFAGEEDIDYNMPPAPRGMGGIGNGAGPGTRSSTQVTIPKDLAGAIIGKGGTRIRKVRIESGADITIDEPLPGSNDRIITITGMTNQIQMAQYLLQQCVHQNAKGAGGGGGGGGGARRY